MAPSHTGPHTVEAPAHLYRVARAEAALTFSEISAEDVAQDNAGNRFDVPGGGLLYCATTPQGCYAETLARFRPSAAVRAAVEKVDSSHMMVGGVPADWRERRVLVQLEADQPLPFLDVEHPTTHEYLTSAIAGEIAALGIPTIDVAIVRGPNRRLTRMIATWAYNATDEEGAPRYSGIRYVSRLGDHECWAIFEGTTLVETGRQLISPDSQALREIADTWALRIF